MRRGKTGSRPVWLLLLATFEGSGLDPGLASRSMTSFVPSASDLRERGSR